MDSLMIVGADRLGAIPKRLKEIGFQEISHVSGRKVKMVHKKIPVHTDLVLVLTDYINHNVSAKLKEKAKEQSIPICYARRSWCSIYQALTHCEEVCESCPMLSKD
ncbi:DUF2325 domain-containing protein [Alteribacillus sp. JSM 102045]|uniref:DUF2325 domain-containing protein n=1 Tax=Alteribacillus sp. JSM 102045 TaxID=1562101 RepID=UPI0035BF03CE